MAHDSKNENRKTGIAGWNEDAGNVGGAEQARSSRHKKTQAERRRRIVLLIALLVLCVACLACTWPINERITRSLMLKGGTATTFEAKYEDGSDPSQDDLGKATSIIARRLNDISIQESDVRYDGTNIIVSLPWNVDADVVAPSAAGRGTLEFVKIDEIGDADALSKVNAGTANVALKPGSYTSFLDGSSVTSSEVTEVSNGVYAVTVHFNAEGAKVFADTTREMSEDGGGRIAIVLNGSVCSAPGVSQEITGGTVSISGGFSEPEARSIKAVLDSGKLPVQTTKVGIEGVGPMVGWTGVWAVVIAPLAVIAAVSIAAFVKFRRLSVIVFGASVVFMVTTLGMMSILSGAKLFTLTMTAVAGGTLAGMLSLGVLWLLCSTFQRLVREGKSVRGASMSSIGVAFGPVQLAWPVLFVASCVLQLTPLMACRTFGLAFVVGTVGGVIAIFWYAVTLLHLLAMGSIQNNPSAWGVDVKDKELKQGDVQEG